MVIDVSELVACEIKEAYNYLFDDYESGKHVMLFNSNQEKDRKQIKKLLKALERVNNYYSSDKFSNFTKGK